MFFSSGSIILPYKIDDENYWICTYEGNRVPVPFWDRTQFSLESIAIKGLKYIGKKGFSGYGIQQSYVENWAGIPILSDKNNLTKKLREDSSWHGKIAIVPKQPPLQIMNDNYVEAQKTIAYWMQGNKIPLSIIDLFEDGTEDKEKMLSMLGRQTYRCSKNKGFGNKTADIINLYKSRALEIKSLRKENAKELWRQYSDFIKEPLSVEGLIYVMNLTLDVLDLDNFLGCPDLDIIADAAYNIRNSYPKKGWEVCDGLVKEEDKGKLIETIESDINDSSLIYWLIEESFIRTYGFPAVTFYSELSNDVIRDSSQKSLKNEDYSKLGNERLNDFIAGSFPYKRESHIITKLLRYNLNKKHFRRIVNDWMFNIGIPPVIWK